jgi:hypothetical protein
MSEPVHNDTLGTEAASRFQCDLYRYWRAVEHLSVLRLGAHRYLTRSAVRRLRGRLDPARDTTVQVEDRTELADLRLYFIRRVLERLGLLRRDPELGLVAGPRSEVERFFALPLNERVALLVKLWLAGGWWVERPDERQEPPGLRAPAHPSVAVGRRQALQVLLETGPDDTLVLDRIALGAPRAEMRREPRPHLGARARRRAAPPVQADTVVSALLGPLCWIGLAVRVARTASEAPALQVTSALDALRPSSREQAAPVLEEVAGAVVVGADFDVLAYPPLTARTLLTLDTCCEPVGSGMVARYALSRSSLVRARRAGWEAGDISRRLAEVAGELPQNVHVTLRDWERQADRIHLRTDLAVLRVRTPRLLDALAADTVASRVIVRRLTPTVALILRAHASVARQWLLRRGEFPAMAPPADE